jgi:hypothetical protein
MLLPGRKEHRDWSLTNFRNGKLNCALVFTLQITTESNRIFECDDDDDDHIFYGVDYDNDYVPKLELRNYFNFSSFSSFPSFYFSRTGFSLFYFFSVPQH